MNKVFVLITLYYPPLDLKAKIQILAKQVDFVYLIDNTPDCSVKDLFFDSNVKLIINNKNLGLSRAYNLVLKKEKFCGDDYVIFFDQDFQIHNHYIKEIVESYEKNRKNKIGIIGPVIYDRNTKSKSVSRYVRNQTVSIVPRVITSSAVTTYGILKEVDFWNERIFLDWADFDLCYRIIAKGYKCAIDSNIVLNHKLGDNSKKFLGKNYPYYSPIREYYQIRDGLNLINEKTTPIKDKVSMIYVCTLRFLIHLIIFDKRKERTKMWRRALNDYRNKVFGEFQN